MTTTALPDSALFAATAPWPGEDDGDEGRQRRGLVIAATTPYLKIPGGWLTPSQANPEVLYRLARDEDGAFCECPDYAQRATACKHVFGLEHTLKRDQLTEAVKGRIGGHGAANGHSAVAVMDKPEPAPAPEKLVIHKRPDTNPAPLPAKASDRAKYDAAQENETLHFIRLLRDLVSIVPPLEHERGRPPDDIQMVLYGLVHKVYSLMSGRRAHGGLKLASAVMGLEPIPRPTLTSYMRNPLVTPILEHLIEMSAVPVSPLETSFSIDSSGFASVIKDAEWAQYKWGNEETKKSFTGTVWTKGHIMGGNRTNIVTAAYVTHSLTDSGDAPQLKKLLAITNRHFNIQRVQGDKAYSSAKNLVAIVRLGATPEIPFKDDAVYRDPTTKKARLWNELLWQFRENPDEFYKGYHARSNVEADFSAIKRLLEEITRSKHPTARINEVLCKILAYNLTRVIHAMYEHGIEPVYGE